MKEFENKTIGEVVSKLPKAMLYFKEIGIDYCCGGYRELDEVIEELSLDKENVHATLQKIKEQMHTTRTFDQMEVGELCDYIVNTHHVYLREVMPQINEYLNAVMRAHGAHHPYLFEVGAVYGTLQADLQQHLIKEEELLFPFLKLCDEKQATPLAHAIIDEHEAAGKLLVKLREVTNNYTLPSDACSTFTKLYKTLQEMEDDLHTHIHLENNILLKKFDTR